MALIIIALNMIWGVYEKSGLNTTLLLRQLAKNNKYTECNHKGLPLQA